MTSKQDIFQAFHAEVTNTALKPAEGISGYPYDLDDSGSTSESTLINALLPLKQYTLDETDRSQIPDDVLPHVEFAIEEARKVFTPSKPLTRISVLDSCEASNFKAPAGFSFPNKTIKEVIEGAFYAADDMQRRIFTNLHVDRIPCMLAPSTVAADETLVANWIFPAEMLFFEGKWAHRYNKFLREGLNEVNLGEEHTASMSKLSSDEVRLHFVWKDLDPEVPCWLIDKAFGFIEGSFDDRYNYHQGMTLDVDEVVQGMNNKLRGVIRQYFKKTNIMLPDGTAYEKGHGIPSGSLYSEAIHLFVNYIAARTLDSYFGLGGREFRVSKNKSSFAVKDWPKKEVKFADLSSAASTWFGFSLKEMKAERTS